VSLLQLVFLLLLHLLHCCCPWLLLQLPVSCLGVSPSLLLLLLLLVYLLHEHLRLLLLVPCVCCPVQELLLVLLHVGVTPLVAFHHCCCWLL
jgi:hypothetical protein